MIKKRYFITGTPEIYPGEELAVFVDVYTDDGQPISINKTKLFMQKEITEEEAITWKAKPNELKLTSEAKEKHIKKYHNE